MLSLNALRKLFIDNTLKSREKKYFGDDSPSGAPSRHLCTEEPTPDL